MLSQETSFSQPRLSADQSSIHSAAAERISMRSLNRAESVTDRKPMEVVVPLGVRRAGELDLERLKEAVKQQQGNGGRIEEEDGEKASEASLTFYFHKEPAVHFKSLTDLKGSPTLAKIMNHAVFWLDIEAYDHEILQSLSQVRILPSLDLTSSHSSGPC